MEKWTGESAELKKIVSDANINGDWRAVDDNQEQFRSRDGATMSWYRSTGTLLYQGSSQAKDALRQAVDAAATAQSGIAQKSRAGTAQQRIFVVHGHDNEAREQLELLLHRLRVTPFVLQNNPTGLTIIEALEKQIGQTPEAEFGIVLITPDDVGYSAEKGPNDLKPRARQNVILEMGMLMSSLGRHRVAILVKGFVELPSDAGGILYLRFEKHVREVAPSLAERLTAAGFDIKAHDISAATK